MSSTSAEDMSSHAVSPESTLGAGATAGAAAAGGAAGAWAQISPTVTSATTAISKNATVSGNALIAPCPPWSTRSQRALVALPGADPDRRIHGMDEDLAVADVSCLGRRGQDARDLVGQAVRHHDLDLDLRQESTVYSPPRYSSVWPFWRPNPRTSETVMPMTPMPVSASLTSSSLNGLMTASIFFMGPPRGGLVCTCHAGVTVFHSSQTIQRVELDGGKRRKQTPAQ